MDLLSPHSHWSSGRKTAALHKLVADVFMWITVLMPFVGLVAAVIWLVPSGARVVDLAVFGSMYLLAGFGVTIGYHRLATHRSFETFGWVRAFFVAAGSMAMQGPIIKWAATHRRHHQVSDHEGDPHSPHLHGHSVMGVLRGLWHAHTGWLLEREGENLDRSVRDLTRDPAISFIDRTYIVWVVLGAIVPFGIGILVKGTILGGLATMVWGFVIRIGLMHHATWSVNSICHLFGYRTYESSDESRNNPVVAMLSLGEGWHNNHHAFPTSARHGLRWYEFDPSYALLVVLQGMKLVWNVRQPSHNDQQAKSLTLEPAATSG